jgi:hypothetical protein
VHSEEFLNKYFPNCYFTDFEKRRLSKLMDDCICYQQPEGHTECRKCKDKCMNYKKVINKYESIDDEENPLK